MQIRGGKSGLHRAGCRLMAGHREVMNSATENKLPMAGLATRKGAKSPKKSWCESSNEFWARIR
jgi:hypothetical protein